MNILNLFLWDKCAETTIEYLTKYGCYGMDNLFESMEKGMRAKIEIMHVLSEIQRNCTRAAIIRDGRIIACNSVDELSKTSAKRITVHGTVNLECLNGVRDRKDSENSHSFLYSGDMNSLLRVLSAGQVDDLTVTEPDLEEIFLHYYEKEG